MLFSTSCSLEEGPKGLVRAHTSPFAGIEHPQGIAHASRYCRHCHGENLSGGENGEPSCFRCHGQNWKATSADISFAPADHTELRGGKYNHQVGIASPNNSCNTSSCHGKDLTGSLDSGTPSCFLCHDKNWD
tara:strand:- start:1298 stop:1693 length:396 start_codon:yes stop_codon:yes gene_type:complete